MYDKDETAKLYNIDRLKEKFENVIDSVSREIFCIWAGIGFAQRRRMKRRIMAGIISLHNQDFVYLH